MNRYIKFSFIVTFFVNFFSYSFFAQTFNESLSNRLHYLILDTATVSSIIKISEDEIILIADSSHPLFAKHHQRFSFNEWNKFTKKYLSDSHLNSHSIENVRSHSYEGILSGVKIAIDPGHYAHNIDVAKMEYKYIRINTNDSVKEIYEADLNWQTSVMLTDMIEREGGDVLLTRKKGKTSCDKNFNEWVLNDYEFSLSEALKNNWIDSVEYNTYINYKDPQKISREFFRHYELWKRISKINMFQPDLTLSIHYNADEKNKIDRSGFHQLHNQQYSMVFVPGAFASDELNEPDELENWLRFLSNTQIEKSLYAARIFQRNIEEKLNIPAVDIKQTQMLEYLSKYSIPDVKKAGVFHRNLFLLQRSYYPIILLEPLLQDNYEEFKKLIENECQYKDRWGNVHPVNCRMKEVAEVYFSALLEWQMNRIK